MTQIVVKVATRDSEMFEEKTIDAIVVGFLAVHEAISKVYEPWCVSHVKTGGLCVQAKSMTRALTAARELQALDVNWDFDDPDTVKSWPSALSDAIRKIRDGAIA